MLNVNNNIWTCIHKKSLVFIFFLLLILHAVLLFTPHAQHEQGIMCKGLVSIYIYQSVW